MMTSQCLNGRVCDRVYDTGRDLFNIGVIEGADTLPEVALVKMMWVLGNEKDPEKRRRLLSSDLKGECITGGLSMDYEESGFSQVSKFTSSSIRKKNSSAGARPCSGKPRNTAGSSTGTSGQPRAKWARLTMRQRKR